MISLMEKILKQAKQIHSKGQKEYAHDTNNVFANFERVASNLSISKEKALLVYLLKHIDGICSHVDGYETQRDSIFGRLTDAIVYLCILWAMIEESDKVKGS